MLTVSGSSVAPAGKSITARPSPVAIHPPLASIVASTTVPTGSSSPVSGGRVAVGDGVVLGVAVGVNVVVAVAMSVGVADALSVDDGDAAADEVGMGVGTIVGVALALGDDSGDMLAEGEGMTTEGVASCASAACFAISSRVRSSGVVPPSVAAVATNRNRQLRKKRAFIHPPRVAPALHAEEAKCERQHKAEPGCDAIPCRCCPAYCLVATTRLRCPLRVLRGTRLSIECQQTVKYVMTLSRKFFFSRSWT
jgi:hypothetical protein